MFLVEGRSGRSDSTESGLFGRSKCHPTRLGRNADKSACRTYSARLGACKCHTRDFKLLDDRDRLLAVYINDHGRHRDTSGRLDYFVELDREEEVMSLAVIVGIQERKEQQRRENAEIKRKREKYDREHPGIYRSQVPFMPIH